MMARKKNKKAIAKRKERSKQKRKQKKKLMRINPGASTPGISFVSRPAMSDIAVPEGYRSVSISQAMMEFTQPLLEYREQGEVDEINDIFSIGMALWNYGLALEGINTPSLKNDLIIQIQNILKLNQVEAENLFREMIERKSYLFPPDIQPENPMIMFIRKESEHEIMPFDYAKLQFSETPVLAEDADRALIASINRMDEYIIEGADYDEWESHFFEMQENCSERYGKWLKEKGLDNYYAEEFPHCIDVYLSFIYTYMHDDAITLKTITDDYFVEFFGDFLLRKVMAKPNEYTHWPPAIKFFYRFLSEKGYDLNLERLIDLLDHHEIIFIEILRKRY